MASIVLGSSVSSLKLCAPAKDDGITYPTSHRPTPLPSVDPRTTLPIIDLPTEMQPRRLLALFGDSVVHWVAEVYRHNRFYHSEQRLMLVTDEHIYTAPTKPNAKGFRRCIPISMIGRIIISDDDWTNILIREEHDLRIKPSSLEPRNTLCNILKIIYRRLTKTELEITNESFAAVKRVLKLEKDKRWKLNLRHPRSKAELFSRLSSRTDHTQRRVAVANDPFEEGFDVMERNEGVTDETYDHKTMKLMACLQDDPDLDPLRYKIIHAPVDPAMPLTDAEILGNSFQALNLQPSPHQPLGKLVGVTSYGASVSFSHTTVTMVADAKDDDRIPVSFQLRNVATETPVANVVPFPTENREMLNFIETQNDLSLLTGSDLIKFG